MDRERESGRTIVRRDSSVPHPSKAIWSASPLIPATTPLVSNPSDLHEPRGELGPSHAPNSIQHGELASVSFNIINTESSYRGHAGLRSDLVGASRSVPKRHSKRRVLTSPESRCTAGFGEGGMLGYSNMDSTSVQRERALRLSAFLLLGIPF